MNLIGQRLYFDQKLIIKAYQIKLFFVSKNEATKNIQPEHKKARTIHSGNQLQSKILALYSPFSLAIGMVMPP